VWLSGPEIGVDLNAASVVCLDAGRCQVQLFHVALAADGVEQGICIDALLANEAKNPEWSVVSLALSWLSQYISR
jgi:hypothetical protein